MNILITMLQGGGLGRQLWPPSANVCRKHPSPPSAPIPLPHLPCSKPAPPRQPPAKTPSSFQAVAPTSSSARSAIVIADALLGEVTPRLAQAVAQADAKRILIPINHCDNIVVGVSDLNIRHLLEEVLAELEKIAAGGC